MYFFLPMVDLRQVPGTDDLSSEVINLLFPLESIRMVRDGLLVLFGCSESDEVLKR